MNYSKLKTMRACVLATMLCFILAPGARATTVDLFDWGFNIDRDVTSIYTPADPLPGFINTAAFDFITGLGTITASIADPGTHYFSMFVDHEIDEADNTFFNEYGTLVNTPTATQTWEIDEPDFVFGNIYVHFLAGALDNSNGVPSGAPDDVAMALAWDFFLDAGHTAAITMHVGETPPATGFYLAHTDPDSDYTLYFSSRITISNGNVPDTAGSLACLALAMAGLAGLRRNLGRYSGLCR